MLICVSYFASVVDLKNFLSIHDSSVPFIFNLLLVRALQKLFFPWENVVIKLSWKSICAHFYWYPKKKHFFVIKPNELESGKFIENGARTNKRFSLFDLILDIITNKIIFNNAGRKLRNSKNYVKLFESHWTASSSIYYILN